MADKKFKIGDRVIGTPGYGKLKKAKKGTVIGFTSGSVTVEYDKTFDGGHDGSLCGTFGKKGCCWHCKEEKLKKIEGEKNMEFKVGQTVKIKKDADKIKNFAGTFNDKMKEYLGTIGTIKRVGDERVYLYDNDWCWDIRAIELCEFTKDDLQDGDIVTLRNGDRLFYLNEQFEDLSDDNDNMLDYLYELNDDLTVEDYDEENDIMKVERPREYVTHFVREEEVKELTVDEISEKLGYKVKVVGNE